MINPRTDRHGNSLDPVPTNCGECGGRADPATGDKVFPGRTDLASKRFYQCSGCEAYVGCHEGTWQPFGPPAHDHTRMMRRKAHSHFDPIWKAIQHADRKLRNDDPRRKVPARDRGYQWLSKELNIPIEQCHIGMMNSENARRVVDLCGPHLEKMGLYPERQK